MSTVFPKSTPVAGCLAMLAVATPAPGCAVSTPADRGAPPVAAAPTMPTATHEPPARSSPTDRQVEAWLRP